MANKTKQIIRSVLKIFREISYIINADNPKEILLKKIKLFFLKDKPIIMNWDNQKFYGNPVRDAIPNKIFNHQIWEPETTEIFVKNLKVGMTVLDIGAQFGYYALLAAKRVGASGQILAFEPKSWIRHLLSVNKHINFYNNIKIYPYGLFSYNTKAKIDDVKSRVDLEKPASRQPSSGLSSNLSNNKRKTQQDCLPETINLVALDNIIDYSNKINANNKILVKSVDLIKIDIEGAEFDAIIGMKNTINKFHPKILVEVHPDGLSYFGYSCSDFFDLLNDMNYKHDLVDCTKQDIIETINGKRKNGFHLFCYHKW